MTQTPPPSPAKPCPMCGKPRSPAASPFCSTRCRDRDLMRWLEDGYAIPGRPADGTEEGDDDAAG